MGIFTVKQWFGWCLHSKKYIAVVSKKGETSAGYQIEVNYFLELDPIQRLTRLGLIYRLTIFQDGGGFFCILRTVVCPVGSLKTNWQLKKWREKWLPYSKYAIFRYRPMLVSPYLDTGWFNCLTFFLTCFMCHVAQNLIETSVCNQCSDWIVFACSIEHFTKILRILLRVLFLINR